MSKIVIKEKVTIWNEISIDSKDLTPEQYRDLMNLEYGFTLDSIKAILGNDIDFSIEPDLNTEEAVTLEENGLHPTVEIYEDYSLRNHNARKADKEVWKPETSHYILVNKIEDYGYQYESNNYFDFIETHDSAEHWDNDEVVCAFYDGGLDHYIIQGSPFGLKIITPENSPTTDDVSTVEEALEMVLYLVSRS